MLDVELGLLTPTGQMHLFSPPQLKNSLAAGLFAGQDGTLWFNDVNDYQNVWVARLTSTGALTMFSLYSGGGPIWPQLSLKKTIWYIQGGGNLVGRITPTGEITTFHLPTAHSNPGQMVLGPDGNLWFTEADADKIGRIVPEP
jgi:virginiamycin B lyase